MLSPQLGLPDHAPQPWGRGGPEPHPPPPAARPRLLRHSGVSSGHKEALGSAHGILDFIILEPGVLKIPSTVSWRKILEQCLKQESLKITESKEDGNEHTLSNDWMPVLPAPPSPNSLYGHLMFIYCLGAQNRLLGSVMFTLTPISQPKGRIQGDTANRDTVRWEGGRCFPEKERRLWVLRDVLGFARWQSRKAMPGSWNGK